MQVVGPKYGAALRTRALSKIQAWHHEVYFSSVSSLLGSPGQSNYIAANAMLDALASGGSQQGLPSAAVQWGAWAGAGMGVANRSTEQRLKRFGMSMISASSGLGMLAALLADAAPPSVVAAVPFLWESVPAKTPVSPFFSSMIETTEQAPQSDEGQEDASLAAASLEPKIHTVVAGILGASVGRDEPLMAAGLDSLGTMELRNSLEATLRTSLPATVVFDYPTIAGLAAFMASQAGGAGGRALASRAVPGVAQRGEARETLALCGVAQRTPLDALAFGHLELDAVGQVPLERWDVQTAPLMARFGAYLHDISAFDAAAFSVSAVEATLMDPQQRLLLETVAESSLVLDASVGEATAPSRARGFFVGKE